MKLNPSQRCKKNSWVTGTLLRVTNHEWQDPVTDYYEITAIGNELVLGAQIINGKKSNEIILPLINSEFYGWKKVNNKVE